MLHEVEAEDTLAGVLAGVLAPVAPEAEAEAEGEAEAAEAMATQTRRMFQTTWTRWQTTTQADPAAAATTTTPPDLRGEPEFEPWEEDVLRRAAATPDIVDGGQQTPVGLGDGSAPGGASRSVRPCTNSPPWNACKMTGRG